MSTTPTSVKLAAGSAFPSLVVKSGVGKKKGAEVDISKPAEGFDWKLIIVIRGNFCPLCTKYVNELKPLVKRFNAAGVDVAVVSPDCKEQAEEHMQKMELKEDEEFPIYYDLSLDQMKSMGLYISDPAWKTESATKHPFAEPAVFVLNEEGKIHIADISNAPFARPDLEMLAFGIEYVRQNKYPIRGTYA